jgi:curved DNA-binding protein CbpA
MRGSLAQRCPADILSEVQRRRMSGVLSLERDRICRQLFVDAGVFVLFAASNHPQESLTSLVLSRAGSDAATLRQALETKQADELLGTTLVRLGLIHRAALLEFTQDHIRRVARAGFGMNDGAWRFDEGALPFREQLDGGLRTSEMILEWTRGIGDAEWVRRRLGNLDNRIQRERRPPEGYQGIRLDPAEGYLMSRVDGAASIREICMVSPMGDERTLAAILGLALAGILEMPEGALELPSPGIAAPEPEPSPILTTGRLKVIPFPARPAAPVTAPPAATAPAAAPPIAPGAARPGGAPTAPAGAQSPVRSAPHAGAAAAPPAAPVTRPPAPPGARPQTAPAKGPGVAGRRPAAAAKPGAPRPAAGARKPPAPAPPPPPATDAELETEMLQRYQGLHNQDLYQVLGVSSGARTDEVRRAYYALARKFHPDKFRKEEIKAKAEKSFARITEAYSTLVNADLRQKYNEEAAAHAGHRNDNRAADTTEIARQNFRHGREHLEHGRLAEALSSLQNACDQDPTRAEYFELLGTTQARNPRLRKQAEENLQKAIEISPTRANAYAMLGSLYERAGTTDRAREMYRRALQWDPENELARKALEGETPGKKSGLLGLFKGRKS